MSRRPSAFTQSDITRALRGAKDAGINVVRLEIAKDGRIVISTSAIAGSSHTQDLDRELLEFEARHGKS